MNPGSVIQWVTLLIALGSSVFVALFLAGLGSAAWEIRSERRRGLTPTRPAWENRDKRRALGGFREQIKAAWTQARHRDPICWCARGPLVILPLPEGPAHACAAWEAGDPVAVLRHDEAGGYAPVPVTR